MPVINRPIFPRLPYYDYSSGGGYFVTLCTANRECLLGAVTDGLVVLSEIGRIVQVEWERSTTIRSEITLDVFVMMPNHLHGIVFITEPDDGSHCRARLRPDEHQRKPRSLGSFIAGFKGYTTKRVNELRATPGLRLWQPDYYEHVIRNDKDLAQIREYIVNNPLRWQLDEENPERIEMP
jgi:putative transposase